MTDEAKLVLLQQQQRDKRQGEAIAKPIKQQEKETIQKAPSGKFAPPNYVSYHVNVSRSMETVMTDITVENEGYDHSEEEEDNEEGGEEGETVEDEYNLEEHSWKGYITAPEAAAGRGDSSDYREGEIKDSKQSSSINVKQGKSFHLEEVDINDATMEAAQCMTPFSTSKGDICCSEASVQGEDKSSLIMHKMEYRCRPTAHDALNMDDSSSLCRRPSGVGRSNLNKLVEDTPGSSSASPVFLSKGNKPRASIEEIEEEEHPLATNSSISNHNINNPHSNHDLGNSLQKRMKSFFGQILPQNQNMVATATCIPNCHPNASEVAAAPTSPPRSSPPTQPQCEYTRMLEEELIRLKVELAYAQTQDDQHNFNFTKLVEERDNLQTNLVELSNINSKISHHNATLMVKLTGLQRNKDVLWTRYEHLHREYTILKNLLTENTQRNSSLQQKAQEQDTVLLYLQQNVEKLSREKLEIQNTLKDLRDQNDKLQQDKRVLESRYPKLIQEEQSKIDVLREEMKAEMEHADNIFQSVVTERDEWKLKYMELENEVNDDTGKLPAKSTSQQRSTSLLAVASSQEEVPKTAKQRKSYPLDMDQKTAANKKSLNSFLGGGGGSKANEPISNTKNNSRHDVIVNS